MMSNKIQVEVEKVEQFLEKYPSMREPIYTLFPELAEEHEKRRVIIMNTWTDLFIRDGDEYCALYQIFVENNFLRVRNLSNNTVWKQAKIAVPNAINNKHEISVAEFDELMERSMGKEAHKKVVIVSMEEIAQYYNNREGNAKV